MARLSLWILKQGPRYAEDCQGARRYWRSSGHLWSAQNWRGKHFCHPPGHENQTDLRCHRQITTTSSRSKQKQIGISCRAKLQTQKVQFPQRPLVEVEAASVQWLLKVFFASALGSGCQSHEASATMTATGIWRNRRNAKRRMWIMWACRTSRIPFEIWVSACQDELGYTWRQSHPRPQGDRSRQ